MKITILGSGSFLSDTKRFSPSYLLQVKEKNILVDCGSGAMLQLSRLGIEIKDLDYIFTTHFHADHIGELVPLTARYKMLLSLYNFKTTKDMKVVGPQGLKKHYKNLYTDFDHERLLEVSGVDLIEIKNKMDFQYFKVMPFKVDHLGLQAYAYRFEANGKIIVFSGDTVMCEGIKKASKDADIFICDCLSPDAPEFAKGAHLTSLEIGKLCKESKVKKVVLSHIMPISYKRDLVSDVKKNFSGEVVIAEDLMEI